jgi:hypothetical protein
MMPKKKNPPLTEKQGRLLLAESDESAWTKLFPEHSQRTLRKLRRALRRDMPAETLLDVDRERAQGRARLNDLDRMYRAALVQNQRLREELALVSHIPEAAPSDMRVVAKAGEREATAFALISDWHCEEQVTSASTNGLNEFNLEIFGRRSKWFFANTLKLLHKEAQAINIRRLVVAVLGDLLSGSIHEDLAESNLLGPMEAVGLLIDTLAGGLWRLLRETDPSLQILVPFKWGNHSRVTQRQRWQTESENSLEFIVAHAVAREFAKEPRIKFIREKALLTYLDIYQFPVRLLHGHAVEYQGGVGGLTIPLNKAIAQWDKQRPAHVTCLGHFHQLTFGSGFVVNGSLIGHSAYAMKIKASPEQPRQAFFLIDAAHGLTVRAPILLDDA